MWVWPGDADSELRTKAPDTPPELMEKNRSDWVIVDEVKDGETPMVS